MTGEHFEEWFKDILIPNVPSNCLIVMDNASYHSCKCVEVPTKSWTKSKLIEWIVYYEISFPHDCLMSELYTIAQRTNITTKYIVDEMIKTACEVVWLPVAHCTLKSKPN